VVAQGAAARDPSLAHVPHGRRTDCRGADTAAELVRQRDKIVAALWAIDADVVGLMETEFRRLGSTDVTPEELAARASSLIGGFGRNVETAGGLSSELSELAAFGLPLDRLQTYVADVAAVTPAQVKATAASVFDPARASVVVAGDGKVFFNALKAKRPQAERIAADKLNLDSPGLQ
jgi:zinc protease